MKREKKYEPINSFEMICNSKIDDFIKNLKQKDNNLYSKYRYEIYPSSKEPRCVKVINFPPSDYRYDRIITTSKATFLSIDNNALGNPYGELYLVKKNKYELLNNVFNIKEILEYKKNLIFIDASMKYGFMELNETSFDIMEKSQTYTDIRNEEKNYIKNLKEEKFLETYSDDKSTYVLSTKGLYKFDKESLKMNLIFGFDKIKDERIKDIFNILVVNSFVYVNNILYIGCDGCILKIEEEKSEFFIYV